MKAAMIVTWKNPFPGRETMAIEYAREVDEYWGKQAADGKCTEPRWYWAMKGANIWIVEGEYETLLALASTPEAQKLQLKGGLLAEDFGWEMYVTGREEMLKPMEAMISELSLA